ncbi:hypothetical protein GLP21_12165 [Photobacterium carnosum]|uniref:Uncharacterized protein n=1 Tax=Photobacterium carnosum TaxID=2023717 RepID=A0A2N4UW10_9GAMM|nr:MULTISPECIES: hypothetical protein [Photobacterium]MCD9475820.1 hypothetical protein [Photobacterium phosphoreum]MCD9485871.1 hypothetical protein [Photobacterium iliopiscarium]MCD9507682.1 hypothetical protein [Photobacterium phosphoreum]MCD9538197.1 hypothetical protein [Photobacterium carnosum]MCD9543001.1 hypothetical protein [Photobacterium carnosum]
MEIKETNTGIKKRNVIFGIETSIALAISYIIAAITHTPFAFLYISIAGLHCILLSGILRSRSFSTGQTAVVCILVYIVSFIASNLNGFDNETILSSIQTNLLAWIALCPMPFFIYSIVIRVHGVKYVEIDR